MLGILNITLGAPDRPNVADQCSSSTGFSVGIGNRKEKGLEFSHAKLSTRSKAMVRATMPSFLIETMD